MLGNKCKNYADTIVDTCRCLAICNTHALRMRTNFPTMMCPKCNVLMNGRFFTCRGGFEWLYFVFT